MLKLKVTSKIGRGVIPPHLTTLSVSWLNRQFKAVAIHRGAVDGTWERPGDVERTADFEALIREAVKETRFQGQTVSLLLAHPRLVQQLIDVPPAKGNPLQKIIRRQAQQQKTFPGEAAWTYQSSLPAKGINRVILHLFPRQMLDELVQGAQRNGLDLVSVVPVSAVVHRHLTQLPLADEEVGLLAAETGGSTTVVIGRGDGELVLVRTLPSTWNDNPERMATDLNRTILFLSQQYGLTLREGSWVFGPGAEEQAQALQRQLQFPVSPSPAECGPAYWATETAKLKPDRSPNFLSPELQKAPQRRVFARVVGVGAALVVCIAAAASVFALRTAQQETLAIAQLRGRAALLEAQRQELQQRDSDLTRKQEVVKLVLDHQPAPIPVWLLGYLGEVVPPELAITSLRLKREDDMWKVRMVAAWQRAPNQPAPSEISDALARLRAQLTNGPFHLALLTGSEKEAPLQSGAGTDPAAPDPFVIEGVIR